MAAARNAPADDFGRLHFLVRLIVINDATRQLAALHEWGRCVMRSTSQCAPKEVSSGMLAADKFASQQIVSTANCPLYLARPG